MAPLQICCRRHYKHKKLCIRKWMLNYGSVKFYSIVPPHSISSTFFEALEGKRWESCNKRINAFFWKNGSDDWFWCFVASRQEMVAAEKYWSKEKTRKHFLAHFFSPPKNKTRNQEQPKKNCIQLFLFCTFGLALCFQSFWWSVLTFKHFWTGEKQLLNIRC